MRTERTQSGWKRSRAFTMVEILVAVGVLAIVAVAIATIFRSIGQTVTTGKRVSELNRLAAQIETVFRDDINAMARDGMLVIRHEYADAGNDVPGLPDDPAPRRRRVDQLMFFARGDYETNRPPIYPGMTTRASEARVYYGHGQRRTPDYTADSEFLKPDLRDDGMTSAFAGVNFDASGARLGFDPGPGTDNPNRNAKDWTLLRHVTLLKKPEPPSAKVLPDFSDGAFYGFTIDRLDSFQRTAVADAPYQIDLQPAATSIFHNAQQWDGLFTPALGDPGYMPQVANSVFQGYESDWFRIAAARFSSGLVDVAATTLAEINATVSSAAFDPFDLIDPLSPASATNLPVWSREWFELGLELERPVGSGLFYPETASSPSQQRLWMINALPTPPAERLDTAPAPMNIPPFSDLFGHDPLNVNTKRDRTSPRMRYEPLPPDLAGGMNMDGSPPGPTARLQQAYRDGDQEALTRSVFLPRCTEFIVEWSYGWTYSDRDASSPFFAAAGDPRFGQIVWFGRDRYIDHDDDDNQDTDEFFVAQFYQRRTTLDAGLSGGIGSSATMSDANNLLGPQAEPLIGGLYTNNTQHGELSADQIDTNFFDRSPAYAGPWPTNADIETAVFGPFWLNTKGDADPTNDEVHDWPWPKLLRITIKLADPSDPSIEQTYQSVFALPAEVTGG